MDFYKATKVRFWRIPDVHASPQQLLHIFPGSVANQLHQLFEAIRLLAEVILEDRLSPCWL